LISAMQSAAERGVQLTSQLLAFSRHQKLLQVTLSVHRSILDIASRNVTVGAFEAARLDVAPGDYIQVAVTDSGHRYRSKRAAASLRAVLHDKGHRQGERASVSRKSTALPSNPAEPRRSTAPSERARR
jgi:hypothetical protein